MTDSLTDAFRQANSMMTIATGLTSASLFNVSSSGDVRAFSPTAAAPVLAS